MQKSLERLNVTIRIGKIQKRTIVFIQGSIIALYRIGSVVENRTVILQRRRHKLPTKMVLEWNFAISPFCFESERQHALSLCRWFPMRNENVARVSCRPQVLIGIDYLMASVKWKVVSEILR